jgi:hypothetical protein
MILSPIFYDYWFNGITPEKKIKNKHASVILPIQKIQNSKVLKTLA